uniref:Fibroblast growth factor 2 n=1 Tax=Rousettus aegyptiacus TaxID=9407 RepID=A0A7J8BQI7_ROUAE|nr:fibroblast growth factor 2 [Rousettus aegyptiacus]
MSCPWAPMPPRARSHDRGLTGFEAECRFLRDARPLSNRSVQEENMLREGVGTVHGVRHPRGVSEDTAPPAPRRNVLRTSVSFLNDWSLITTILTAQGNTPVGTWH